MWDVDKKIAVKIAPPATMNHFSATPRAIPIALLPYIPELAWRRNIILISCMTGKTETIDMIPVMMNERKITERRALISISVN